LSGGEQSRLRLCILMKEDINFLILDEPTNHLDIASREWIEQAIESYGETLLFVSHDRYFINRFATRVWELEEGKITDFRGTYEQYRNFKNSAMKNIAAPKEKKPETPQARKKGATSPEKQLAKLEREIAALEEKLKALAARRDEFCSDYEKLIELDSEEAALRTELDEKYDAWAELGE
jgi:ATPase subunit of ABC transporter with duplicated ATPase domains